MARRKSNNGTLTALVTALIALPIVIAIVFKFIFKALAELVEFIGKCIEKHQQRKCARERETYYSSTSHSAPKSSPRDTYNSYEADRKAGLQADIPHKESGASTAARPADDLYEPPKSIRIEHEEDEPIRETDLYRALRVPGDPDPDLSLPVADEFETYEDELDDEEILIDDDEIIWAEAFDRVSESDIEIMGLALYDMLMHNDD